MGSTAATLLLTLVVRRMSVPGSMRSSRRDGRQPKRFVEQALHGQAVVLDRLDVRGAADQRDVVMLGKLGAVDAADRAGAEDDDPHDGRLAIPRFGIRN